MLRYQILGCSFSFRFPCSHSRYLYFIIWPLTRYLLHIPFGALYPHEFSKYSLECSNGALGHYRATASVYHDCRTIETCSRKEKRKQPSVIFSRYFSVSHERVKSTAAVTPFVSLSLSPRSFIYKNTLSSLQRTLRNVSLATFLFLFVFSV